MGAVVSEPSARACNTASPTRVEANSTVAPARERSPAPVACKGSTAAGHAGGSECAHVYRRLGICACGGASLVHEVAPTVGASSEGEAGGREVMTRGAAGTGRGGTWAVVVEMIFS